MKHDEPHARISPDQSDQHTGDVSFLRRWSERKTRAREKGKDTHAESLPSPALQLKPCEQELTDADMPPLAALSEDSDYSGFFSPKVSAQLRRLALRKLFHSPGFNVTDGLDDYAEDFRSFAKLGDTVTQDMLHRLQVEARRAVEQPVETVDENAVREEHISDGADTEENQPIAENDGDLKA